MDLVIEKDGATLAVEIKSSTRASSGDLSGLVRFAASAPPSSRVRSLFLYRGTRAYTDHGVDVLPWRDALSEVLAFLRS